MSRKTTHMKVKGAGLVLAMSTSKTHILVALAAAFVIAAAAFAVPAVGATPSSGQITAEGQGGAAIDDLQPPEEKEVERLRVVWHLCVTPG